MAIAYHVVFGTYGFWLPNDPRGSWSKHVFAPHLRSYGPVLKAGTRESLAHVPHNHAKRSAAKIALNYPPVRLSDIQILSVAQGFDQAVKETKMAVYACAIMSDHTHFVIGEYGQSIDKVVARLKSKATKQLNADDVHPLQGNHTPWAKSFWQVYLDNEDDVREAIKYVESNPIREGLPKQEWSFVSPMQ